MPRKTNYGVDYDDGYGSYDNCDYDSCDNYDDYDFDCDDRVEEEEKPSDIDKATSKLNKEATKPALWQCYICTFDNDPSISWCEMCGVIRNTALEFGNGGEEKASFKFDTLSPDNVVLVGKNSRVGSKASFKFDTLSPDNVVLVGKNSRVGSKVSLAPSISTTASAKTTRKKGIVKFSARSEIPENSYAVSLEANYLHNGENSSSMDNDEASQILASNLHSMKLDKNSTNIRKTKPLSEYKQEKWMLYDQAETLSQLNLAIVGHVDSGKSTLSGRLLHLLGRVSKKAMHKFEKEANEMGKKSFAFAYAMDECAEERERGVTMTVAVAYFDTKKYHVVLLDSPGHKDFVPNLISGATQADAAVLVVDASTGSFEAGMDGHGFGQTKEHAQLIRSFGAEQIIVAVNKMDMVGFSKDRFDFIKLQLGTFLRSCGFKEASISWVPLSAIENQNLVTPAMDARLTSWYKGCCLLDAIDSLTPPSRDISKPLWLPICDVVRSHSLGQVSACGKLQSGAIQNGSKVIVMPLGDLATVRAIERDSRLCTVARAGDNVAVSLHGIDSDRVMPGGVLCHPDYPVTTASRLELRILVLDVAAPILVGSQMEFHIHHAKEAARVVKIVSSLDQKTGKASNITARFLTAKQSAVIEIVLDAAVCVEEFSKSRALGRAFLRAAGCTAAVGIVTRVLE